MTNRVLVLFVHPALESSRINVRLLSAAQSVSSVTVHDLYELYPDFAIDVRAEQRLLLEHDVLVFQHPLYWYNAPPLLKQWIDLVYEHHWAYGEGGTALSGKRVLHAVTAGGPEHAYRPDGHNRYSVAEFLRPFEGTAHMCGMKWLPPLVVYGTHNLVNDQLQDHERTYRDLLHTLSHTESTPTKQAP